MAKSLTPLPKLIAKAQAVFNAWVRRRDAAKGCISCSAPVEQAGHYLNTAHYSAYRFDELNVNGQCIRCNMYLHGNLIAYRKGLVRRYGEQRVTLLEGSMERRHVHKWTRLELEAIIDKYKLNGKKET